MTAKASQILASAIALNIATASAATVTFEGLLSGAGTYNNNAGVSGAFNIDNTSFSNNYNSIYDSWSGFAISKTVNTTTADYTNYGSLPGKGADDSDTYAVSYGAAAVKFATSLNLNGMGASMTNTTYAGLLMQNGDPVNNFSKKFGGVLGNDPDYFKLTISGFAGGTATGTFVDFYLADFRFADNRQDYIVNKWTYVDFSTLGTVDEIRFSYASSDVGQFGINTPTYFALDNFLAVPEPSAAVMGVLGCLGLLSRRRR
jgi:Domain of unknown function (DUF4465)